MAGSRRQPTVLNVRRSDREIGTGLENSLKFNAVRLTSAPGALAEQIKKQIEDGKLKPGTVLPSQRELAKLFKVGLGSVREAIKILDVMGYLEVIRGKGTFVSNDLPNEETPGSNLEKALEAVSLADLMRTREVVECACAGIAATAADRDDVAQLIELTDAMEASFLDTEAYYRIDFNFHLAVAEATHNKVLSEIVKLLVDRAHSHIGFMDDALSISLPFNVEQAVETAREITRNIASGDADLARRHMHQHLNIVKWQLEKKFLGESDDQ